MGSVKLASSLCSIREGEANSAGQALNGTSLEHFVVLPGHIPPFDQSRLNPKGWFLSPPTNFSEVFTSKGKSKCGTHGHDRGPWRPPPGRRWRSSPWSAPCRAAWSAWTCPRGARRRGRRRAAHAAGEPGPVRPKNVGKTGENLNWACGKIGLGATWEGFLLLFLGLLGNPRMIPTRKRTPTC